MIIEKWSNEELEFSFFEDIDVEELIEYLEDRKKEGFNNCRIVDKMDSIKLKSFKHIKLTEKEIKEREESKKEDLRLTLEQQIKTKQEEIEKFNKRISEL